MRVVPLAFRLLTSPLVLFLRFCQSLKKVYVQAVMLYGDLDFSKPSLELESRVKKEFPR